MPTNKTKAAPHPHGFDDFGMPFGKYRAALDAAARIEVPENVTQIGDKRRSS